MSENLNDWVIVAIFDDEETADRAVKTLKGWDKANDDIKLGAIGVISKKGDEIKTHVGRKTGKGVGVGAVVGIIAGVLSGGLTVIGGALAAGAFGGVVGSFFHKSTDLSEEDVQEIGTALEAGKAAVVVRVDDDEVVDTADQLTSAGGTIQTYIVPEEVLNETAAELDAAVAEVAEATEVTAAGEGDETAAA